MSGPWYRCTWWRCQGTKLVPHTVADCPHLRDYKPVSL